MEPLPVLPVHTVTESTVQAEPIKEITSEPGSTADNVKTEQKDVKETTPIKRSLSEVGDKVTTMNKTLLSSQSFPSLSDHVLRQLGLWLEENKTTASDTELQCEKEVESNFTALVLAFQTDRLTLKSRLELQNRLRDQAEQNMANEIQLLQNTVLNLCEKVEHLEDIQTQIDALHKAALRVSSAAELYGAVQQENRLSKAVDVILRHVENLKQAYHKEKTEHVETKKVLSENKPTNTAPVTAKPTCRRRATIAVGVAQNGTNGATQETLISESIHEGQMTPASTGRTRPSRFSLTQRDSFGKLETLQRKESQTDCSSVKTERSLSLTSNQSAKLSTQNVESSCSHYACNSGPNESDFGEDSDGSVQDVPVTQPVCKVVWGLRFPTQWSSLSKCSTEELILHARYGVAAILLLAAVAVFCSTLYI